ncbi:unnamed protein product [Closterium sp. Naga37s-1]|nr:unnamed protein product [Closterium sp. Naga37s-1]
MSVAAGVSDAAIAIREKLRGRIAQTKVKRYWPGKAPEWADDAEEARGGVFGEPEDEREEIGDRLTRVRVSENDARLRRLGESRRDREEAVARHREIRAAEIVSTREEEERKQQEREEEEEEEDEDAIEERRRRIRERLLQRQREEEELAALGEGEEEEEEEEEEEDSSEYETDSEEEGGGMAMIKPVFVPKGERDTVAERERVEQEERDLEEAVRRRVEERKAETRRLVVDDVRREEEKEQQRAEDGGGAEGDGAGAAAEDVETDDEMDAEEEFERWRAREKARVRREREERDAVAREKEERERISRMTEEERREWERRNPKAAPAGKTKTKWKFMQKYYHKGAFFQAGADDKGGTAGTDEIFARDYSEATGEDRLDKSVLPAAMQVSAIYACRWACCGEEVVGRCLVREGGGCVCVCPSAVPLLLCSHSPCLLPLIVSSPATLTPFPSLTTLTLLSRPLFRVSRCSHVPVPVKHFGRSGRSKWTHLVNEDTTQQDSPSVPPALAPTRPAPILFRHSLPPSPVGIQRCTEGALRARSNNKMAGMDKPFPTSTPHSPLTPALLLSLPLRWAYNDALRARYNNKMAGMDKPLEKPKGSKKLKNALHNP